MKNISFIIITMALLFTACKKETLSPQAPGELDVELGIEAVPTSLGSSYTGNFNRYTKVVTPNGGTIHIVAQSNITKEQMIRCRSILQHYLTDYEGSTFGADKSAIANKMAENNAILTLLNGRDGSNSVEVDGQPLYEEEIQVEGHAWYVNQSYESHRDAAFEEILHLVHDYGIGVDGANSSPGAAPALQSEIRAAQNNALSNNLWGIGSADWISELTTENSLSQEYLASVIDVYYGLWGARTEEAGGMWGIYVAKTRADIIQEDPMGQGLLENKFFHPYLTYNARIDETFSGTYSLKFDASIPYSHHAQYLKDITLLGNNDTNVVVNELDNDITGNEGSNRIIFSGNISEYQIQNTGDVTVITDNTANRDGTNTVRKVNFLQFLDETVTL